MSPKKLQKYLCKAKNDKKLHATFFALPTFVCCMLLLSTETATAIKEMEKATLCLQTVWIKRIKYSRIWIWSKQFEITLFYTSN